MSFYYVGRIADKANADRGIIEAGTRNPEPDKNAFLSAIAANKGGVAADYDVLFLDNNNADGKRSKRESFLIVWTGDLITSLDFSPQASKKKVDVLFGDSFITGGVINVSVTIRNNDNSVDITFNNSAFMLPISTPTGKTFVQINVSTGSGSVNISPDIPGRYSAPAIDINDSSLRVADSGIQEFHFGF